MMLKDIDWVRNIAEKIDKENNNISIKIKKLEMDNFIEESEKKYLINKIIKENEQYFLIENIIFNYKNRLSQTPSIQVLNNNTSRTDIMISYQNLITQNFLKANYIKILDIKKKEILNEISKTKNLKSSLNQLLDSKEKLKSFFKKIMNLIQSKINNFQDENFLKNKIFNDNNSVNLFENILHLMQQEKFLLFLYDHIFLAD